MYKGRGENVVYLVCSKTFDTVSWSILIVKLARCGLARWMDGKLTGLLVTRNGDLQNKVPLVDDY